MRHACVGLPVPNAHEHSVAAYTGHEHVADTGGRQRGAEGGHGGDGVYVCRAGLRAKAGERSGNPPRRPYVDQVVEATLRHCLPERSLLLRPQLLVLCVAQVHALEHRAQELRVPRAGYIAAVVVLGQVATAQDLDHFALGTCVRVRTLEHVCHLLSVERFRAVGAVPLIAGGGAVAGAASWAPVASILNLAHKANNWHGVPNFHKM